MPHFQRAIVSCGIGAVCLQRGGPPLAVAGRSQGRGGRTSVKRGAEGCDVRCPWQRCRSRACCGVSQSASSRLSQGRSQGRSGRTSVKRGAVGCDEVARGRRSVTNLGRLSQRVTGGCDRFFWLVTRGVFFLSHCHNFS